ncbi:MAG: hypothetical protein WCO63_04260 [Bacteroidota bacterium]
MEELNYQEDFRKREKKYRMLIALLCGVILILAVLLVVTRVQTRTLVVQTAQVNYEKVALKTELDSLIKDHERIKTEYKSVSKNLQGKDSLILANAKEIEELLAYKYDYNKIKKKLDRLRLITQGYVHQIDSLFTVNAALKTENKEIKGNLSKEREKNVDLSKEKETLTEKVNQAALLKAYNVTATTLRSKSDTRESATEKARRADKVKVCFTLSENPVAEKGKKTVYIRIARPDNVIITEGLDETSFMFNGQKIQYSMKQEVDYTGSAQNICVAWSKKDKKTDAMKGIYHVACFIDGYEIGQGQFELK